MVHKLTGKGTKVKMVVVSSIGEKWIISIAKAGEGIVHPEPVPCFWTFCPSDTLYEGDEHAEPGEKVILYVNGGYVLAKSSSRCSDATASSGRG